MTRRRVHTLTRRTSDHSTRSGARLHAFARGARGRAGEGVAFASSGSLMGMKLRPRPFLRLLPAAGGRPLVPATVLVPSCLWPSIAAFLVVQPLPGKRGLALSLLGRVAAQAGALGAPGVDADPTSEWKACVSQLRACAHEWAAGLATPMPFELAHALDGLMVHLLREPGVERELRRAKT